jgi:hypothetical protein
MVHPWQHAQGFGLVVFLNTILERSILDSLLMMHPLLASMFSVDLNMILERSTLTIC